MDANDTQGVVYKNGSVTMMRRVTGGILHLPGVHR